MPGVPKDVDELDQRVAEFCLSLKRSEALALQSDLSRVRESEAGVSALGFATLRGVNARVSQAQADCLRRELQTSLAVSKAWRAI